MNPFAPCVLVPSLLAISLSAQSISVTNPVAPGAHVIAAFVNTPPGAGASGGGELRLMSDDGEMIHPVLAGCGSVGDVLSLWVTGTLAIDLPATGSGTQGSFLLRAAFPSLTNFQNTVSAVARLDVGAPSASFASLHFYPAQAHRNGGSHWARPADAFHWEISNVDQVPHTLTATDFLTLHAPGYAFPFATVPLQGLVVPAGQGIQIALPIGNLPIANLVVHSHWQDPAVGPRQTSLGLYVADAPALDLQLPSGHTVPPQGSLPIVLASGTSLSSPPPARLYALAFGILPGVTPLPGGGELPLVYDFVVAQSLANGLLGVIDHPIGVTTSEYSFCAHRQNSNTIARGLHIVHPNVAAVQGLVLRCAAITIDPSSLVIQASQAAEVQFR
jgi:hypothetical protein